VPLLYLLSMNVDGPTTDAGSWVSWSFLHWVLESRGHSVLHCIVDNHCLSYTGFWAIMSIPHWPKKRVEVYSTLGSGGHVHPTLAPGESHGPSCAWF